MTSTAPLSIWKFPGNPKKTRLSHMKPSSLVFFGTLFSLLLCWQMQRKQIILQLLLPGSHSQLMCSLKYNISMESCYMPASWFSKDVPTSPPWNQYSVSPVLILLCHITLSNTLLTIFPGGLYSSPTPLSINLFSNLSTSSMPTLIPMPALVLESQLLSMGFDILGPCYQDGTLSMERKTLSGPRLSDLSCSFVASFGLGYPPLGSTFASTVTISELSMGGRMDFTELELGTFCTDSHG